MGRQLQHEPHEHDTPEGNHEPCSKKEVTDPPGAERKAQSRDDKLGIGPKTKADICADSEEHGPDDKIHWIHEGEPHAGGGLRIRLPLQVKDPPEEGNPGKE